LRCIIRAAGDARCPASSRAAVRTVIVSAGSTAATIAAKAATSAVPIVFYGSDYVFSPLASSAIQDMLSATARFFLQMSCGLLGQPEPSDLRL